MRKNSLIVIMLITILFTLAACSNNANYNQEEKVSQDSQEVTSYSADDTWAIYWYLCGSDLESGGGAATMDLEEMFEVTLPENVKVIIQTGGASDWMNELVDPNKSQRYVYSGDTLELVEEQNQVNMGQEETLEEFLTFCEEEYPADHKMVLFWNHGGGSVGGAAYDENYEFDSLSLTEMKEAFAAVYDGEETPLELVGFDTCLMSTLDTANIFKDYAAYLVASEELEPGNGWNYSGWLGGLTKNPGMNGAELGTVICDTYVTGCEEFGTEKEITLSVTDLGELDSLLTAFEGMGKEILSSAIDSASVCGEFARSAEKAENYGGNNEEEGYTNMVDLGDLISNAKNLLPETAHQVLVALEDAIVYKVNGIYRENATGLSIFYSYNGNSEDVAKYHDVATEGVYPYFIHYLIGEELPEEAIAELDDVSYKDVTTLEGFSGEMPVEITQANYARLTLDPDGLDSVKSVFFNLAYYNEEDDSYVFLGTDNDLTADWDNGIFEDNFRGVWGALDGNLCYMEITYEGEDYNLYSVPIYLNRKKCVMRIAYDYGSNTFEILGAREEVEEDTTMADKNLIQLNVGDEVNPILYTMSLSDENADFTEVLGDAITLEEGFLFEETDLGDGTYSFTFEVVDTTNQTFYSEDSLFDYRDGDINYLVY